MKNDYEEAIKLFQVCMILYDVQNILNSVVWFYFYVYIQFESF